jgi:hypothetical protein
LLHSPILWWLICSRDERVVATNNPYLVGVDELHIFPRFAALWSTRVCFFNEGFSGGVCVQHLRVQEFQTVVSDNSVKCNPWGRDFSVFFCFAELGRFVDNLVSAVELWLQTLATSIHSLPASSLQYTSQLSGQGGLWRLHSIIGELHKGLANIRCICNWLWIWIPWKAILNPRNRITSILLILNCHQTVLLYLVEIPWFPVFCFYYGYTHLLWGNHHCMRLGHGCPRWALPLLKMQQVW